MKTLNKAQYAGLIRDTQSRLMLAGRTPDQFFEDLTEEQRHTVYRRSLLKSVDPVVVLDWDAGDKRNLEVANRHILLHSEHLPSSENGRRIIGEARAVYYTENKFVVASHLLRHFLDDEAHAHDRDVQNGCTIRQTVERLIRDLTVLIRIDCFIDGTTQRELEPLLLCKNVESLRLQIGGRGSPDGIDLETQLVIKALAAFVHRLMEERNGRLRVEKTLLGDADKEEYVRDITGYWQKPDEDVRKRFYSKDCTDEDAMRMQVEGWATGGRCT